MAPGPRRRPARAARTGRVAACRPRPVTEAPPLVPDAMVAQLDRLLTQTGIIELIEAELAGRPGPAGLPVRTVLLGLLLSIHYTGKATLAAAWRTMAFSLTPAMRARHALDDTDDTDEGDRHAQHALSRRFYRAFDKVTTVLDVARVDRRRRLDHTEAEAYAAAWDTACDAAADDHGESRSEPGRRIHLLQEIVTRLVLTPVASARGRGYLKHYGGDVGIDATAIPTWATPPRVRRATGELLASIEICAGWHHSAGDRPPAFGYSATLALAARTRHTIGAYPQLALGLVVDTPHKRIGHAAITTLNGIARLGLPPGALAVDRAYTDQAADHFARPARALGYRLALDYKIDQRGLQGSVHGALLVDGTLTCPLTPAPLIHATTGLGDDAVRTPDRQLAAAIEARQPYFLKLKQSADDDGKVRFQCPAAGPAPSLNCPRLDQALQAKTPPATAPRATPPGPRARARVNLADLRQRAAHAAAKPTVLVPPGDRDKTGDLPKICTQQTITLRPGDLGVKDKLRQDLHYLSPAWQGTFKTIRANTEGINGRIKGQVINLSDPTNRLAHGRVAQTLLVALMICIANQQILLAWRQVHEPPPLPTPQQIPNQDPNGSDRPAVNGGRPPPDPD
jgi:hypothetical protein